MQAYLIFIFYLLPCYLWPASWFVTVYFIIHTSFHQVIFILSYNMSHPVTLKHSDYIICEKTFISVQLGIPIPHLYVLYYSSKYFLFSFLHDVVPFHFFFRDHTTYSSTLLSPHKRHDDRTINIVPCVIIIKRRKAVRSGANCLNLFQSLPMLSDIQFDLIHLPT